MNSGMQLNRTDSYIDIHSCHRLDVNAFVLTDNPSALCFLLNFCIGLLSLITICGNLLVIISIVYFRQLHTPTNYLILSLAIADLLVGFVVFPLTIQFSISSCLFEKELFYRYYSVCQPLTYRAKITESVALVMISVSWTISAFIGIGVTVMNTTPCKGNCFVDVVLVNIIGLIFGFYAPVFVMLCIYFKIFLVAQKQARSIQGTQSGVSKMEKKATKTLATVMGLFLLCWLPFYICTTVLSFSPGTLLPLAFIELLNWLALINSTLNPFIYAFFYSWFRAAFRMIISGKIFIGDFANFKLQ
ncbi:trace amine-associated receptor 1-like [Boleophthalmus pectinirostris]|uniref:trace amine-associated receptor 1-like n=1 Tax=Boleophthalmus pectinirostris TaxID=150288 RepID=UPI00242FCC41|nr:trace amine-associated receptor 1-like [Boleophthalmus pectinirostris]